jgi:predicted glycogen debranching enzyme
MARARYRLWNRRRSRDGLLKQGAEGYALTWMDAKVDDWVVTPRRGKAVEINALWYNALKLLEGWLTEQMSLEKAARVAKSAQQARESFNARFWYEPGKHLFDVIDGPGRRSRLPPQSTAGVFVEASDSR